MKHCRLRVRGLVQGVGFRPHVWRLANELALAGWVMNDGDGVLIEVHGPAAAVDLLRQRLIRELPRLARVDQVEESTIDSEAAASGFAIVDSVGGRIQTAIGPDAALCPDCIADLCDAKGRRWRYAFTTCTHCGPRYTVSHSLPYDRVRTSLAAFPLCPLCAEEYNTPSDRRFHAETTCCPACGPQLRWEQYGRMNDHTAGNDPLAQALALLSSGGIVAIKGLGGFHLACDARNAESVATLRRRKAREEKPFAVMALNAASLAAWAEIGAAEQSLLNSAAAPIVLCRKGKQELPGVAPGLPWLGVLLPSTPLHLLLWHEAAGRPEGTDWLAARQDLLLVMTSANPGGEPLVIANDEALERLAAIADGFLLHDRDIVVRCDDSVVTVGEGGAPAFIRRARGYTPQPIQLVSDGPSVLAFGALLKNTVCVLKGREAFLSQHVGSLDNVASVAFQEETVAHLLHILDIEPEAVAHDVHPDFASTHAAIRFAAERALPCFAVAHHHAHLAAIAAEHRHEGPLPGLALDGVGLGPEGGNWGGELLHVDGADCVRLGHLRPLPLPGGDRAAREPWRMAVSALDACGQRHRVSEFMHRRYPDYSAGPLLEMLDRGFCCPMTSSLGRLFDAAAGLLGLRPVAHYEGQAAMELEGLAACHGPAQALSHGLLSGSILDFSLLLSFLAECDQPDLGAAVFHATVAAALADWLAAAAEARGLHTVACAGGCAMNRILMHDMQSRLTARGLKLLLAQQVPPNDGGLSLGQAAVARLLMWR